jgi:hypothetical protein
MTLSEQLETAKRRAEVETLNIGDEKTAAEFARRISLPPIELSADIRTQLDPFNRWASNRHARRCPAKPATVALFVLEQADMGVAVETILAQLNAIEQMHAKFGLSSPVRTAAVRYALETLIKTDPPRSWPTAEKAAFAMLPPDIRHIIALRQEQADRELRRLQSKVARKMELLRQEAEPNCKSTHIEEKDQANDIRQNQG